MDKEQILLYLAKVLEKDIEDIKNFPENAPLSDNGLDSIKFISFIVELENTFGFEVYDSDLLLTNFETLEKTYNILQKYFKPDNTKQSLKKCLVLDCDGVLWKGIAGEENIIIDEQVIKFQNELVKLYEKGVLLCLCSKNEPENIYEIFQHFNMPLKQEHITLKKINANDKIQNIKEISTELNISTDSLIFVDDNPYEIGLVSSLMPEVETVKADYTSNFIDIINRIFSAGENIPQNDLNRTKLYIEQKERVKSFASFNSVEEYNASLETKIICAPACTEHITRIAELSQRTNQFNLAAEHYSKEEIENFIKNKLYTVLYLSASDKYGDMSIVAAAVVKKLPDSVLIKNFMLSCRVFGRGFEYIILNKIKDMFKDSFISGVFKLTEKNKKHNYFYKENGVEIWENTIK